MPSTARTEDPTDSVRIMRDLYALAAFYVAHPNHPRPATISVYHYADAAEIKRLAAEHDVEVRDGMSGTLCSYPVPDVATSINVYVFEAKK